MSGETTGLYTAGSRSKSNASALLNCSGEYRITIEGKEVDAERLDSCPACFVDEALDDADENCMFALIKDAIAEVATRNSLPGRRLLGRYGHAYWCLHKW
jgi:hypothetical protein